MNIIAGDDEKIALEGLISVISKVVPECQICGFKSGDDALKHIDKNSCDIVFLDIEMRGMNGISLAKKLKLIQPQINIIFTTGYSEYAPDAFELHASGYVMKPITEEKIKIELDNLRHPLDMAVKKRLNVKTFGNFECFVQNEPIQFKYNKTRELFAYLVDRNGAMCSNGEIISILWEDSAKTTSVSSYLRNLYSDLIHTLDDLGCHGVIVKSRGRIGINPDMISCDYYDWLKGKAYAINLFNGEYMTQYSWSDFSLSDFQNDRD